MNYEMFLTIDKFSQVEITLEEGAIIGQRLEHGDLFRLFHMGAFYVELLFLNDLSEVVAIYHSQTDNLLTPYLSAIDISEILSC